MMAAGSRQQRSDQIQPAPWSVGAISKLLSGKKDFWGSKIS